MMMAKVPKIFLKMYMTVERVRVKTCIILYRTSLRQDYQQQNYPPPTSPNFENTLEREEDREGGAEALHHVLGLSGVTSEL